MRKLLVVLLAAGAFDLLTAMSIAQTVPSLTSESVINTLRSPELVVWSRTASVLSTAPEEQRLQLLRDQNVRRAIYDRLKAENANRILRFHNSNSSPTPGTNI